MTKTQQQEAIEIIMTKATIQGRFGDIRGYCAVGALGAASGVVNWHGNAQMLGLALTRTKFGLEPKQLSIIMRLNDITPDLYLRRAKIKEYLLSLPVEPEEPSYFEIEAAKENKELVLT